MTGFVLMSLLLGLVAIEGRQAEVHDDSEGMDEEVRRLPS